MKTINIIYYNNGVGFSADSTVIKSHLKNYNFNDVHIKENNTYWPEADINIFLQTLDGGGIQFIHLAKRNVVIPNQEWIYWRDLDKLVQADLILTKSEYCKRLLQPYNKNIINIGFSSRDVYNPIIKKTKLFLHLAGKSIQKNTQFVINCFKNNGLPLTLLDSNNKFLINSDNITHINHYVTDEEVCQLINEHQYHICSSLMEGWGHYIYEALSANGIVLVTDCPPMNEIIPIDKARFIPCFKRCDESLEFSNSFWLKTFPLRECYFIDKSIFNNIIESLTPINNIREYFLYMDARFGKKIQEIFYNLDDILE